MSITPEEREALDRLRGVTQLHLANLSDRHTLVRLALREHPADEPPWGMCNQCLTTIHAGQAMVSDELGMFHALCRVTLRAEIAEQALAELREQLVPADDNEPVTEEWLESVGFVPSMLDWELRDEGTGYAIAMTGEHKRWDYMGRWIKSPETRGDVRRLCAALGIDLT